MSGRKTWTEAITVGPFRVQHANGSRSVAERLEKLNEDARPAIAEDELPA